MQLLQILEYIYIFPTFSSILNLIFNVFIEKEQWRFIFKDYKCKYFMVIKKIITMKTKHKNMRGIEYSDEN